MYVVGEPCREAQPVLWTADVEQSCIEWKATGVPPFPVLSVVRSPSWHHMSLVNLRYLYNMALIASTLELSGMSGACLSWAEFPM